jgi:hypothetical protein
MTVRRGSLRRNEREELVAYIHGIDPEGELAHILVHQRGSNIRFSGRLGAHNVSPSNSSDLEKWVQEAKIVWELDETIGIPRSWTNTPETLEKIEMMKVKATQKKNSLEALRELQV